MKIDPAIFDLCPDANIKCINIGQEQQPLLMVDSFMQGATVLKNIAIAADQFSAADSFYPGIRMKLPLIYALSLTKNLRSYIENFFGLNLKNVKKADSCFSIITTPPKDLSLLQRIPHFDAPSKNSLAMLHYLCDVPDAGTAFYRHRELGYEYVDRERCEPHMSHLRTQFSNPSAFPVGYINGDTPEFEQIYSKQAVFNRLLMYRGSSLHSGNISDVYNFDPSPSTGRLTVASFIEFE